MISLLPSVKDKYNWAVWFFVTTALATLTIWVFWPTSRFDFVAFDDDYNIFRNEHLGRLTWDRIVWMFTDAGYTRRYMPLGWFTFSSVISFTGFGPRGFHLANILIHTANTCLFFLVLSAGCKLAGPGRLKWPWIAVSWMIAFWWAVSPLRVEVVAWSSGLLYNVATLFLLLAVFLYLQATLSEVLIRRNVLFVAAGIFFILSLLTYPIMLGGAAGMVALEGYLAFKATHSYTGVAVRLRSAFRGRLIPWMVSALTVAIISYLSAEHSSEFWRAKVSLTLRERFFETPYFFFYYLTVPWCPFKLAPVYDTLVPPVELTPPFVVAAVGAVFIFAILVWSIRRTRPGLVFAALAFLGLLLPVCPLFHQLSATSDRYAQSVMLLMGFAGVLILTHSPSPQKNLFFPLFLGIVIGFSLPATLRQNRVWSNTETLMEHTLRCLPRSGPIRRAALIRLIDFYHYYQGSKTAALEVIQREHILGEADRSLLLQQPFPSPVGGRFVPAPSLVLNRVASTIDIPLGDFATARARLVESLRWSPEYWEGHYNLALVELALGHGPAARAHFEYAVTAPYANIDEDTRKSFFEQLNRMQGAKGERPKNVD